jgi:hypothetical protein
MQPGLYKLKLTAGIGPYGVFEKVEPTTRSGNFCNMDSPQLVFHFCSTDDASGRRLLLGRFLLLRCLWIWFAEFIFDFLLCLRFGSYSHLHDFYVNFLYLLLTKS